jgi:broad specificity phosphatase PhoE
MEIGVVRHFPVPHRRYKWVTGKGFDEWIKWYDNEAEVKVLQSPEITDSWDYCYCSDMRRARITASTLYKMDIVTRQDLREVPFAVFPFFLPLPVMAWKVLSRLGWWAYMGFQTESRDKSLKRSREVINSILKSHSGDRVLLVTHGFFMQYINKELLRSGFKGHIPIHPEGGSVYIFSR